MKIKKSIITISLVLVTFIAIITTGIAVYANYALDKVTYVTNEVVELEPEEFEVEAEINPDLEIKDEELSWEETVTPDTEGITNILLCGEENIGGGKRGRTDCMILVTINMNTKTMRMVSFMRDLYVPIEGHSNNKLNASYAIGGMPLLVSTLEDDFGINIDGYVLVDFAQFEGIIDLLGGVEIELTEKEAKYLNENNYIDEEENRKVVVGLQTLNGDQALGYSRIRYVSTKNGLANDFGRIWRQKQVLLSIYEKYRNISYLEMTQMLPEVLSMVTTDLSKDELIQLGINVLSMRDSELEQTYVPFNGCFSNANVNGMSVLYIDDIEEIRAKLQAIIRGDDLETILEEDISETLEDTTIDPTPTSELVSTNENETMIDNEHFY